VVVVTTLIVLAIWAAGPFVLIVVPAVWDWLDEFRDRRAK
jgi:hypothetical protein